MWKGISLAAIGFMIAMQCILVPPGLAAAKPVEIFWDGDTVISDAQKYSDAIIFLQGDLTISGSLTFSGVELVVDTATNGEHKISVEKGGTFNVLSSCNIHSSDPEAHYLFRVLSGGTLKMDASELHDCGWDDTENWTVNPSTDRGLYIEADNVRITNCTISENNIGILVDGDCSPSICNNTITMNTVSGIEVYNGGSPLIDGNEISQNHYGDSGMWYYFVAGIASEGSSPVITNNSIFSNIDTCGILISGGSGTLVSQNEISGHVDSYGYGNFWGIECFAESATISDNSVFRNDNGIVVMGGDDVIDGNLFDDNRNDVGSIGIYDASMSEYHNNTVDGSTIGVLLGDGSAAGFWNLSVVNATDGVNGYSDMSPFNSVFENCTFKSNTRDVNIEAPWEGSYGGGTVTLVNPDYSPAKVRVVDDTGVLVVKWYVKALVVYESDQSPVGGAEVKFKDAKGAETGPQATGSDGWTEAFTLAEYKYNGKTRVPLSPQELCATCGTRTNTTKVEVSSSKDFCISLHDLPPLLVVDTPENGTLTNQTSVEIRGRTEPGALVEVDGSKVDVSIEGDWKREIALAKEGPNELVIQSWDAMMNKARLVFVVFRDTITPVMKLDAPSENALVNTSSVVFSGSVNDPGASLAINGAPVAFGPDGNFSVTVALEEGRNTVELAWRDAAGNGASLLRHVSSDTIAPMLRVNAPVDGSATNASTVIATGMIESGAELTINGQKCTAAGTGFQSALELSDGKNAFEFIARDRAGNANGTTITVLRDSTAPALEIVSPADDARFNTTGIVLSGTTEAGATVKVDGVAVPSEGGSFSASLGLKQGANTITVEAWDALLNHAGRTVTVFVDSIAPALKLTGPANGTLTNQTSVVVNGETEPGATVTVAGNPATVNAQGKFSAVVPLGSEGLNALVVVVQDGLNNTAAETVTVRRDTVVGYNLSAPKDGLKVKAKNVTVSGKAEPGATVVIGNVTVPLGADGSFSLVVPLSYGRNTITLAVNDSAGNSEVMTLNVTRVKPPGGAGNPLPVEAGFLTVLAVLVAIGATGIYFGRKDGRQ